MAINDYMYGYQGYPIMGNERFQGENEIYQNMDQDMNYRGADPFGSFNSGVGSFYNTPRGIPFHPSQGNVTLPPSAMAPADEGLFAAAKRKGSEFMTPIMALLQAAGGKRSPEKQAAYDAITGGRTLPSGKFTTGMYGGNEYELYNSPSGLKVGSDIIGTGPGFEKNFDSAFGSNSLEDMEQKKIDWALARMEKFKGKGHGLGISQRLYQALLRRGVIGDNIAPANITVGDTATTGRGPVTTGGGGTFAPAMDEKGRRDTRDSWHGATQARGEAFRDSGGTRGQVAGPGFGRGAYWAEGGRVGYQDGELVEDEYMAEATPGGMMEENIEEVQGEPSREQLEAIALEIFRLPLEELNEEQLNVVYQAAMEQEPAEEEVQFAAQEGPGEGIASLV